MREKLEALKGNDREVIGELSSLVAALLTPNNAKLQISTNVFDYKPYFSASCV